MSHAVGRRWDTGSVGHGRNRAKVLRGLCVGHDLAVHSVDAREVLILAFARLKGTIAGVVGGVVGAANTIELVLAEAGVVGLAGVTGLEAKGISSDKAG